MGKAGKEDLDARTAQVLSKATAADRVAEACKLSRRRDSIDLC